MGDGGLHGGWKLCEAAIAAEMIEFFDGFAFDPAASAAAVVLITVADGGLALVFTCIAVYGLDAHDSTRDGFVSGGCEKKGLECWPLMLKKLICIRKRCWKTCVQDAVRLDADGSRALYMQ